MLLCCRSADDLNRKDLALALQNLMNFDAIMLLEQPLLNDVIASHYLGWNVSYSSYGKANQACDKECLYKEQQERMLQQQQQQRDKQKQRQREDERDRQGQQKLQQQQQEQQHAQENQQHQLQQQSYATYKQWQKHAPEERQPHGNHHHLQQQQEHKKEQLALDRVVSAKQQEEQQQEQGLAVPGGVEGKGIQSNEIGNWGNEGAKLSDGCINEADASTSSSNSGSFDSKPGSGYSRSATHRSSSTRTGPGRKNAADNHGNTSVKTSSSSRSGASGRAIRPSSPHPQAYEHYRALVVTALQQQLDRTNWYAHHAGLANTFPFSEGISATAAAAVKIGAGQGAAADAPGSATATARGDVAGDSSAAAAAATTSAAAAEVAAVGTGLTAAAAFNITDVEVASAGTGTIIAAAAAASAASGATNGSAVAETASAAAETSSGPGAPATLAHGASSTAQDDGHGHFQLYPPRIQVVPPSNNSKPVCCGGIAVTVTAHPRGVQQIGGLSITGSYYVFFKYGMVMRGEMYERLQVLRRWDVKLYRTAVVLQQLDVLAVQLLLQGAGAEGAAAAEQGFSSSSSSSKRVLEEEGGAHQAVGEEAEQGKRQVGLASKASSSRSSSRTSSSSSRSMGTYADYGINTERGEESRQDIRSEVDFYAQWVGDTAARKLSQSTCHMRNGPVPEVQFSRGPTTWEEGIVGPLAPPVPTAGAGIWFDYMPKVIPRLHGDDGVAYIY